MKRITRALVFYTIALFASSELIPGLSFQGSIESVVIAAVVLTIAFHFVEPIIKLIFLPINLITLGFFTTIIHAVVFWGALQFLRDYFTIQPWRFPGWTFSPLGITLAPMEIGVLATIFIAAIMVSAIVTVANKLV